MNLFAFKREALEQFEGTIPERLAAYQKPGNIPIPPDLLLATPFQAPDQLPELPIESSDADVVSAKNLYRWLQFPTERDARDARIWSWLTHSVFADYCRTRWPLTSTGDAATRSVQSHWFLAGEGQGAVGRHALARLWWGAHSTHNAAKRWGIEGLDAGEWTYTEILLGVQNVNVQIRDRTFSGNPKILLAALESLRQLGLRVANSINDGAAWLGRELNMVARYRSLDLLPFQELLALCNQLIHLQWPTEPAPGAPPAAPPSPSTAQADASTKVPSRLERAKQIARTLRIGFFDNTEGTPEGSLWFFVDQPGGAELVEKLRALGLEPVFDPRGAKVTKWKAAWRVRDTGT